MMSGDESESSSLEIDVATPSSELDDDIFTADFFEQCNKTVSPSAVPDQDKCASVHTHDGPSKIAPSEIESQPNDGAQTSVSMDACQLGPDFPSFAAIPVGNKQIESIPQEKVKTSGLQCCI